MAVSLSSLPNDHVTNGAADTSGLSDHGGYEQGGYEAAAASLRMVPIVRQLTFAPPRLALWGNTAPADGAASSISPTRYSVLNLIAWLDGVIDRGRQAP
jgi:hypothetical protein